VTFATRNTDGVTYTPISGATNLLVGLVDPNDRRYGTASAIVQYNLGNASAATLNIAVIVGGNYLDNKEVFDKVITVAKPTPGQIIGAGDLNNTNSSGYLVGAPNRITSFGWNVKSDMTPSPFSRATATVITGQPRHRGSEKQVY
jgi:hypothetical protein